MQPPSTSPRPDIVIGLSKRKLLLLLLGAIAFVGTSGWLWTIADTQARYPPGLVRVVGVLGALFFGLGGVVAVKKLFGRQPGLVLDEQGIWDNSSAGAPKMVRWANVRGFEVIQISRTRLLLVLVNNPQELLSQQRGWKQQLMRMNLQQYGTPYAVSSNSLQIGFDELVETLTGYHAAVNGAAADPPLK